MRHGMPLAIPWLLALVGFLPAQERIPLPAPDPAPPEVLSPPRLAQTPSGLSAQPDIPAPDSAPLAPPSIYPPPGPPSAYPPEDGPGPAVGSASAAPPLWMANRVTNPNVWIGLEGLIWWIKDQPLSVPLLTTGPASQGANAGNLNMPGTTSLDGPLNYGAVGGFRFFAGGWFNPTHTIGMEGSFFILGQDAVGFGVTDRSGVGSLVINEPVTGAPFNTQVSAPGVESGDVFVGAKSEFGGGDINLMVNLCRGSSWTVNLLGGYRYLQLDESITISANSNLFVTTTYTDNLGNVLATATPGSNVLVVDQFGTRNQFNGGQVGAQFQYVRGLLFVGGTAKLGIGATHEVVTVNGSTTVYPVTGDPIPMTGGNYASLQVGRYATDRFALAPQGQVYLAYQVLPFVRAQIGYDLLFLTSVARPGSQIDNSYDGVAHPYVPMSSSSFWAQGLSLGLQFNF